MFTRYTVYRYYPFRGDRPSGGIQIHGAAIPYANTRILQYERFSEGDVAVRHVVRLRTQC